MRARPRQASRCKVAPDLISTGRTLAFSGSSRSTSWPSDAPDVDLGFEIAVPAAKMGQTSASALVPTLSAGSAYLPAIASTLLWKGKYREALGWGAAILAFGLINC